MTDKQVAPVSYDLDVSKLEDENEDHNGRILFDPKARKYMLGKAPIRTYLRRAD